MARNTTSNCKKGNAMMEWYGFPDGQSGLKVLLLYQIDKRMMAVMMMMMMMVVVVVVVMMTYSGDNDGRHDNDDDNLHLTVVFYSNVHIFKKSLCSPVN